jgi:hypothetical protein
VTFKPDHHGMEEVLKSAGVAAEIHSLAREGADNAGDPAWVDTYTTDRAAASVTIPAARQAKHGTLTKAASAAGLEVTAKRG